MSIDLYYTPHSPPCRAVLMVADALNLKLNLKLTSPKEKEQLKPEFLKINPQHTIPTIVDNGVAIWESRAILTYLVNQYAKGSSLYPGDPKARALVDQRLYFDIGTLYPRFFEFIIPQFAGQAPDEAKRQKLEEALDLLEKFLEGQQYIAGATLTLADYSILAVVSIFSYFGVDISKYPNIKAWYERMKSAPGYGKNEEALADFPAFLEGMKKKSST